MSEELKINITTDTDVSETRKKIDSLIKEYDKRDLEFQVKLGKFDISGISSSIARLTSDLNALSNVEFSGLNKLETNLKNINKLMAQQNSKINVGDFKSETNSSISKLVQDQKGALDQINELDSVGKALKEGMSEYNRYIEQAFKDFNKENESAFDDINFLKNSSSSSAFKKILQYKEEMESLSKELGNLGVALIPKEKTFEMDSGRIGVKKWTEYEDLIGQSEERFKSATDRAKEISKRTNQLKKNLDNNLKKISDDERYALESIDKLKQDLKPMDTSKSDSIADYMKAMLKDFMSLDDMSGLDLKFDTDMIKGYEKFLNSIEQMKKDFNNTFKNDKDFVKFDLFEKVDKVVENLDKSVQGVNLDNLKEKLTNAFDIDEKVIANIEKIENALKQLNSMSELTQKSLFDTSGKSGMELDLDNKIKEYLSVDKSINDAYTKMSKAQLNGNNEVVNALEKEIGLLRQKQALYGMEVRGMGADDQLLEQIRLQEQLNRAISETNQIEHKNSFMDKLHKDALKLNQEFDEMNKKQQAMRSFDMPDISTMSDVKSYVDYLDSAEDGLKRILTQYTKLKGVDLTTTIYGDGTEVRKVTGNMEKATNELATAYKQADNELTKLIKTQQQMDLKGDSDTVALLDKQISNWKQIKSSIEDAANGVNLYDRMIEKSQSTLMKNKQILDTNQSRIDFTIDVNNQNAINKFEEFKTKALSSIQEIERKYQGTNLFDSASNEANKLRSELEQMEASLRSVDNVDLSNLQGDMRAFNQSITQTRRDLNDLNRNMSNGFFSNFGDEFRNNLIHFTAGELLADGIRSVGRSLKTLVMEYDTAMANLKKVANPADIMQVDQLDAIQGKAVDIAKNVGMASQDVIQAISDTIQMGGYGMEEATKVAEQTMMLANVAEMTQEAASKGVVTMMSAFDLDPMKEIPVVVDGATQSTDELTNAMDKLNYVGNNFSISSSGILDAITSGANVLAEYGVTMNDTIAMVTASNTTLQNPEKVGNGLKSIAINLAGIKTASDSGELSLNKTAMALNEIAGIDIYSDKKNGELKDMTQIVEELSSKWSSFTEEQRAGLSEAIAGKYTEFILTK